MSIFDNNNSSGGGGGIKPGAGDLFVYVFLIGAVTLAFLMTGGTPPSDPNGPNKPKSLPKDYSVEKYGQQKIVYSNAADADLTPGAAKKLQLKTFKVDGCVNNVAIDFLVDTSGSFAYDGKLDNLKKSLKAFTKRMSSYTVIGMETFSAVVTERVPLDYYVNQKVQMAATIDNLKPLGNTRTRDGFELADKLISDAKKYKKFPGYNYVLILLTDGIPEMNPTQKRTCEGPEIADPLTAPALRCFAREEDPRVPSDIPADLKRKGVTIYTVGIYSPNRASDAFFQPKLEELLHQVSSQPYPNYYFSSVHGGNLDDILDTVFSAVCS
jgi:hypothetical protein